MDPVNHSDSHTPLSQYVLYCPKKRGRKPKTLNNFSLLSGSPNLSGQNVRLYKLTTLSDFLSSQQDPSKYEITSRTLKHNFNSNQELNNQQSRFYSINNDGTESGVNTYEILEHAKGSQQIINLSDQNCLCSEQSEFPFEDTTRSCQVPVQLNHNLQVSSYTDLTNMQVIPTDFVTDNKEVLEVGSNVSLSTPGAVKHDYNTCDDNLSTDKNGDTQDEDYSRVGSTTFYENEDECLAEDKDQNDTETPDTTTGQYFPTDIYIENDIEVESKSEYEISNTLTQEGEVQKIGNEIVNTDFMQDLETFVNDQLQENNTVLEAAQYTEKYFEMDLEVDSKNKYKNMKKFNLKNYIESDSLTYDSVEQALSALESNSEFKNSSHSSCTSSPSVPLTKLVLEDNLQKIPNDKQNDVIQAAKSLFSKRTRTLYHWMFPNIPKKQLKNNIATAWDNLPENEKHFYISQVLGRFGLTSSNLMINPQLDALTDSRMGVSVFKQPVDETEAAVKNLFDTMEDPEQWASRDTVDTKKTEENLRSKRRRKIHDMKVKESGKFTEPPAPLTSDYDNMFKDDYELSTELERFKQLSDELNFN